MKTNHYSDTMLMLDRWRRALKGITYKPGWTFALVTSDQLEPGPIQRATLRITYRTPDVHDPTQIITLKFDTSIDLAMGVDEYTCRNIIAGAIVEAELHERDEWLKWDGVRRRDPHPDREWVCSSCGRSAVGGLRFIGASAGPSCTTCGGLMERKRNCGRPHPLQYVDLSRVGPSPEVTDLPEGPPSWICSECNAVSGPGYGPRCFYCRTPMAHQGNA